MRVGLFADTHDHLENIRRAVQLFVSRQCELVLFAGDLVSTFAVPPLRALTCPLVGCFGENEGNKAGIQGGLEIIGSIGEPPLGYRALDGTKFLITHQWELLRGDYAGSDIVVFGHTHKPLVQQDSRGRLLVNPGETSGWTYRRPTVAILETATCSAEIVELR
jgi:putative phosphoesterase